MKTNLAKLKKVKLRDVWAHEAHDFTRWLAEDENLQSLSEAVGMEITLIQTEAKVGKFNVDILAEESITEKKIIIENQLEVTNHDHLGKLITYAAGHDAKAAIWIVKEVSDEHKKSIEWLNNISDEGIGFFLIKIELLQIENSSPAPRFELISSPNEWAKVLKNTKQNQNNTDTKLSYLKFWENFVAYGEQKNPGYVSRKPHPHHWYDVSFGTSEGHIALTISKKGLVNCGVYINDNKGLYNFLLSHKDEIESKVDKPLQWIEANKATRIYLQENKFENIFDEQNQKETFDWFMNNIQLFIDTFSGYINKYKQTNK